LAPMVDRGYCTSQVIETWLEQVLLPNFKKGQVIIMDNARFHQGKKVRELIENPGCELLFLPKYSPDLNPIDHWWPKIKNAIKKELHQYDFNLDQAVDAVFAYLSQRQRELL
jgi:transposase